VEQKKAANPGTIHIGDFLATQDNCGMVHYVAPVYPTEAKRAHIEGVVKFDVVILKTGEVGELNLVSGDPALVPAAIKAVKQWRYAPCRLNGEPVEVKTQIDVSFTLRR
jgi:protein TonB